VPVVRRAVHHRTHLATWEVSVGRRAVDLLCRERERERERKGLGVLDWHVV
jgi:hypothetical protein